MTPYERQGIADALRAALPYLWDGVSKDNKCLFICHALQQTNHPCAKAAVRVIMSRIQATCDSTDNLFGWLITVAGIASKTITFPKLQAHRRAWMLELIKEFES